MNITYSAIILCYNSTLDVLGLIPCSPPPSDYIMPYLNILLNYIFCDHSALESQMIYGPNGASPIVLKKSSLCLYPAWVSFLTLFTMIFPSWWKFYIEPVPNKRHSSNPSNYLPTALSSWISTDFESPYNLLSNR